MHAFRRRQFWTSAVTLLVQLGGTAVLTIGLCCQPPASSAADELMPCCKNATGEHICPLPKKPKTPAGQARQTLGACCDPELQVLAALIGTAGVLVSSTPVSLPLDERLASPMLADAAPRWLTRVESPPPKA